MSICKLTSPLLLLLVAASPIQHDVETLAAPGMEGRGIGTKGIDRAADYIEGQFKAIGLQAPAGGYSQKFDVTVGSKLGDGNRLSLNGVALAAGQDWIPFGFSDSGTLTGPLLFAGYGITDPTRGYDDYASLDVTGKTVLVLRYEPQEDDPKSLFDGTAHTSHATLRSKVSNAKAHGAAGLLLVTGPVAHEKEVDELVSLATSAAEASAGFPCAHLTLTAFCRAAGIGPDDVRSWQTALDKDLKAPPTLLRKMAAVDGSLTLVREKRRVRNIVGILQGQGDGNVVVGAHYDHLGYGNSNALDPDVKAIHPGADDNASGTAAMIETARAIAKNGKPNRTHVFVAFTGEESGLLGSAYFVKNAPVSISRTALMLNYDMVGRMKDRSLNVMGTDTGAGLKPLVEKALADAHLTGRYTAGGYGPSDHSSFYAVHVPVLFFFTGAHADYHRATDTADKINAAGEAEIVAAAVSVLSAVDSAATPPAYVEVTGEAPAARGGGEGYGAYFGVIPEFGDEEKSGVNISGARANSPAAKAGLLAGDRVVSMAGKAIGNLYDLTYALRSHRPGETVTVEWIRSGKKMSGNATLERRGASPAGGHGPAENPAPTAGAEAAQGESAAKAAPPLVYPGERHFAALKQITFGGENAEAYWSPDGKRLIFQSTRDGYPCDQEYVMNADGSGVHRISTGQGRCTCGYFLTNDRVLWSSTHEAGPDCPPPPDRSKGYSWALYPAYDIYSSRDDGSDLKKLQASNGYDAEATVSPDGRWIVFTSTRDGDPELYLMKSDGTGVQRLTTEVGYDGGAVFSPDSKRIVYRASRPARGEEFASYRDLMAKHVVRPSKLEIYTMDLDSRSVTQVTKNGAANFAPCWHPDGTRILFASNQNDPKHRNFDLYLIGIDGSGQEQITYCDLFDGFPLFSPDGKRLAFSSNRNGRVQGETNVFVADWKD